MNYSYVINQFINTNKYVLTSQELWEVTGNVNKTAVGQLLG